MWRSSLSSLQSSLLFSSSSILFTIAFTLDNIHKSLFLCFPIIVGHCNLAKAKLYGINCLVPFTKFPSEHFSVKSVKSIHGNRFWISHMHTQHILKIVHKPEFLFSSSRTFLIPGVVLPPFIVKVLVKTQVFYRFCQKVSRENGFVLLSFVSFQRKHQPATKWFVFGNNIFSCLLYILCHFMLTSL